MGQTFDRIHADLAIAADDAKEFIGEFFFSAFGVQSSDGLNTAALYALLGLAALALYRVTRPVHSTRYRPNPRGYDFGRYD